MSSPTSTSPGPGIEKYGSKTDAFIKVMLVFFISLLSFSVGTYVGKKFSDKEHKLAQLEPQGANAEHDTGHGSTNEDKSSHEAESSEHGEKHDSSAKPDASHGSAEALSDDEIAKLAQEFVSEDEVKNKLAEIESPKEVMDEEDLTKETTSVVREVASVDLKEPAKAIHDSTKKTVAAIAKKTEKNIEANATASKAAATSVSNAAASAAGDTAASAAAATAANGKYTVQVSAFTNEKDANKLKTELNDKGLSSLIIPAEVKGKQYYRVSVGLFKTESDAKVYLKDLLNKDVVKSAIVQKVAVKN